MLRTLQIVGDSRYGGATYLLIEWCRYLTAHGVRVDVLTTDGRTKQALAAVADVSIIDAIYIPRDVNLRADLVALKAVYQLIKAERYDVVHTYTATPGLLGRVAARLAGVPRILHHQAGWATDAATGPLGKAFYSLLESAGIYSGTLSICVGNAIAERRPRWVPATRFVTICNGIEPPRFEGVSPDRMAARARRGIEQNTIVLGTFGRLSAQKSLDTLIRAIPLIRQTVPARAIKVLIAGDGPLQAELEALASELGVSGMVTFEGFVENIPEFLDLLDVFVITSLWEGLSIALLEAMARACPIVATDIPPNAELIQDGVTGLLVPTHNPLAVAESVANLIQYPSKAQELGLSAQRIAKAKYGLDHMLDETWRLYVGALRHLKPSDPSRN